MEAPLEIGADNQTGITNMNMHTLKSGRRLIAVSLLAGLGMMGITPTASATLLGDTVNLTANHEASGFCTASYASLGVTVGAGIELGTGDKTGGTCNGGVEIDVHSSSFDLIGFHEPSGFADYTDAIISLEDLDWVGTPGRIVGVTFDSLLTDLFNSAGEGSATELPTMAIAFTDDSITVTFDNSTGGAGGIWEYRDNGVGSFTIQTDHVPEPGSVLLLGLGLAGLAARKRRARG
jgi:hypothetical protein